MTSSATGGFEAALNLIVVVHENWNSTSSLTKDAKDEARNNVYELKNNREPDKCRILQDASVGWWLSFHNVDLGRSTTGPV